MGGRNVQHELQEKTQEIKRLKAELEEVRATSANHLRRAAVDRAADAESGRTVSMKAVEVAAAAGQAAGRVRQGMQDFQALSGRLTADVEAIRRQLEQIASSAAEMTAPSEIGEMLREATAENEALRESLAFVDRQRADAEARAALLEAEAIGLRERVVRYERHGILGEALARKITGLLPAGWNTRTLRQLLDTPKATMPVLHELWKFWEAEWNLRYRGIEPAAPQLAAAEPPASAPLDAVPAANG